jgi:hypothetical protein
MAEFDKDIFGQADALLRRHAVAPPRDGSETGGVPVLTDFVETPDGEPPPRTPPEPEPVASADPAPADPAPADSAPDEITREVINRVMAEVEQRLAVDLERRVIEHLTPQVHAAVMSAMGDLHQELANAIGDAIAQALERRPVK